MNLELYIDNVRVDLFKDEAITITDTQQNIRDIALVFTPFSQQFNLPASSTNNKIFKHYYNNDIVNGYDARFRVDSIIKLDGADFKVGKIRLDSVSMKNNKAHAYKVVFFGNTSSLKDIFGDETLSALNPLNAYDIKYNNSDVLNAFRYGLQSTGVQATLTENRNITLPLLAADDEFIFKTHAATLTNKTLTSPNITGPNITGSINDANGAELIRLTSTASAVNEISVINAATGSSPSINTAGTDTNINLIVSGKGTGSVSISKAAYESSTITATGAASETSSYIICNSGTAIAVSIAAGTISGEYKVVTNKGAGTATITPSSFGPGTSVALDNNEGCTMIWDGTNWQLIGNYGGTVS